jgi:hypothetical protein
LVFTILFSQGVALGYELLPPSGRAALTFEYLLLLYYFFLLVIKIFLNYSAEQRK